MTWIVNIAYLLASVFYLPILLYQMVVQKKNRRGWRQRFGHIHLPLTTKRRIWMHAVSLGEVNCTPALVRDLASAVLDAEVVVSTTTDTGYARACQLYTPQRVFRYPLDLSWMVGRALDRIRPALIVLVELEVWPNLVHQAYRRGIPVAVINGRLTERSARRLARAGRLTRGMFSRLDWVGAQDQAIAERFGDLGTAADRIEITGSLKWDTAEVLDSVPGADALVEAMAIPRDKALWVCGSTGPGEEALILDAYQKLSAGEAPAVSLAIVPRKPERFDEVATLIRSRGFDCIRRSERPDGSAAPLAASSASIFLGDTMGELRKFYALARVVFVGRSLVPMGGSDPMEVAALAKPVIVGPHMGNFQLPVGRLEGRNAICVVRSPAELCEAVRCFLQNKPLADEFSRRARQVVLENQGATARAVEALCELIDRHRK
ncbi:MAG: 3-deoxy-D-manno-octulosonic acid transferase [Phycisphaerae bacterium]|nr:3-deoxy-D-manno-octulosonic acid transferase [Phycisphaerae bacterium]